MPAKDASPQLSHLLEPHTGERAALVHEERSWSYAELEAHVRALAADLDGLRGERVAFMLPTCPAAVTVYLACFRTGAVAAPLNTRYAPPEIEGALRRARPRLLIVDEERATRLDGVDPAVLAGVRVLVTTPDGDREPSPAPQAPRSAPDLAATAPEPEQPAVLFFTSGSTGPPKGVVHSHRSALAMVTSTAEAMGGTRADDVTLVCDPLVHVSGFIETLSTLMAGGTAVLQDGFDLPVYVEGLRRHRPTLICTHIDVISQVLHAPGAEREWFSSLRGVYTGGDTVPGAVQSEFRDLTGLPIGVGYGLTEAIWLTVDRAPRADADGAVGSPVGGAELRTDEETGELLVRGPMLMAGYWEDEALTRESMTQGWLHTGDLGVRDAQGGWRFRGRVKDLIVRRTSKITPGEVESAIDRHPEVSASAVVAADDPTEGQVPVAFVVVREGSALTAGALTAYLRGQLAAYKVPGRIHFLAALPLTASGKIAHHALHEPV